MTPLRAAITEALTQTAGDEFDAALRIVRQLRDPEVGQAIIAGLAPRLKLLAPTMRQAIEG